MYLSLNKRNLSRFSTEALNYLAIDHLRIKIPKKREKIISKVRDHIKKNRINEFILFCPYCNTQPIIVEIPLIENERSYLPKFCVFCGESEPPNKFESSLEKINIFLKLIKLIKTDLSSKKETYINNILEQCLVIQATSLEILLRDTYSIIMNNLYVKENQSLYSKFYNETKNDFTNFGKASSTLKKYINLDLKTLLTTNEKKSLNLLINKRHLIVHNNGIIDKTFLEQTGLNLNLKDKLQIDENEIIDNMKILSKILVIVQKLYNKQVGKDMIDRINNNFDLFHEKIK